MLTLFSSTAIISASDDPFPPTSALLPHSLSFKSTTNGSGVSDLSCGSFKIGIDKAGLVADGPEYLPK